MPLTQMQLVLEEEVCIGNVFLQILNPRIKHVAHPIRAELDHETCPVRSTTWEGG